MKRILTLLAVSLLFLLAPAHAALAAGVLSGDSVVSGDFKDLGEDGFGVSIDLVPVTMTIAGQVTTMTASASWAGRDGTVYPNDSYPAPSPGSGAYGPAFWYQYWGLKLVWSSTNAGVVRIEQSGEYGQNLRVTSLREGTTDIVLWLVRESDPASDPLAVATVRNFTVNRLYNAGAEMSGIPNNMTIIGQTSSLSGGAYWSFNWGAGTVSNDNPDAYVVYYPNPMPGPYTPENSANWTVADWYEYWGLALRWGSSNPSVAAITDQYGDYGQYVHLVSYRAGTADIFVELFSRANPAVALARDSVTLNVTSKISYTNMHPDVARLLGLYNTRMSQYSEQFGFAESDPAGVAAQSFQSAFTGRFGVSASQVTELPDADSVAFDSAASFAKSGYEQLKPSMRVAVSSLASAGGALLPVAYSYKLSWGELRELLGRDVTSISDNGELFGKIGLVFENENGEAVPVIDGNSYSQALAGSALRIENGVDGLTLALSAMLADVNTGAVDRAAWIGDSLVVADGKANGTSGGSMWLVKKSGDTATGAPADSGSGGGGGGCSAGTGGSLLLAALGIALGLRRR